MSPLSPEKAHNAPNESEVATVTTVTQPLTVSVADLGAFLEGINDTKVSETTREDASSDFTQTGKGGAVTTAQGTQSGMSVRDQAIANLPIPVVMQKQLEQHIRDEVKKLRSQAKTIAAMSKPGGAYKANQLYARIRHLNAILASLFDASMEIMKRLYIRVFVDKQNIQ
jgi:hypothetical protein